ncbi:E3 ubiquitin-protein ligase NRDP1-like [Adelges cooleyi]|uniref:E3 ubiquitin-protein ligase NRDP1-like n=1 Tax=Adelges cooleyi TaxID=133065 RepID=UPI00217FBE76|nr:E3 ubiquitin-protein ligase NRDP1-like [Adelges cooleyi]
MQTTEGPTPHPNIEDWINSLVVINITNWSTLSPGPSKYQKDLTRDALKNSGCPTDIVEDLLLKSYLFNWPDHFKKRTPKGFKMNFNIKHLIYRRIPGVPVVYVAHIGNEAVPKPGILLIFDRLE